MLEGRLSIRLVITLTCSSVPEFISDVVSLYDEGARLLNYDKFTESTASLRIGNVVLGVFGGSGGLVRVELAMDNCTPLSSYSDLVIVFRKLMTSKLISNSSIKQLEITCIYEAYIPLTTKLKYGPKHVSKVLSNYGILVSEVNSDVIDGMELLGVSGTLVVGGLGVLKLTYVALLRDYAVRSSLSISRKLMADEFDEKLVKRLTTELYVLAQSINEELYLRGMLR